ncbi:MAG: hypothetical protein J5792_05730 [Bacteroidales bacterium]|nr:hypothetical protein [Bacteroidales bacterium]
MAAFLPPSAFFISGHPQFPDRTSFLSQGHAIFTSDMRHRHPYIWAKYS